MKRLPGAFALFLVSGFAEAGEPKPVKTGWNSMTGHPYDFCSYLEVTGPEAAKALILKRAKEQYREADPQALAAVEGKVVVRFATMGEVRCSRLVPKEMIFVNKATDKPVLRLPMDADTTSLQNGFGATWTSTDGVATVPVEEFKTALGEGKFNILVVLASGDTLEMKAGLGNQMWSGGHTKKVFTP